MSQLFRTRVVRADGRAINVVQRRAHLSYCFTGCCCGRTERGYAPVPADTFKDEWLRRKLRNAVHLTKAGCLGPCALANVASLVFDGRAVWFHSVNTPWHVRLIFDYIETMVRADRFVAPPSELAEHVFNYYDWDVRPRIAPADGAAELPTSARTRIALLSHADTDVLVVRRARELLPADLEVVGIPLLRLQTEEQLELLLTGDLAGVRAIAMRLHGELSGRPMVRPIAQVGARTRRPPRGRERDRRAEGGLRTRQHRESRRRRRRAALPDDRRRAQRWGMHEVHGGQTPADGPWERSPDRGSRARHLSA